MPNIWPALPILIYADSETLLVQDVSNLIAALEHHDRVGKIDLRGVPTSLLKQFGAMEKPFPELTAVSS